ncbi:MAG: Lrp/AsnC ligand binding domain-containing protein [Thiomonas sp.]|uniref:Lrp/AsnC ligand binding domain-containing protein n=1 Tax=Thiomonas sp. TaxID=2047785 RepID=UPI002A36DCD5|nr:Lrp/AsnC ligand binding domain-containing protein [Thiomonas sp.]MDY0330654.1 Lrp/AsnC ligand binding domain-containing protein [Thiomonas sp.]
MRKRRAAPSFLIHLAACRPLGFGSVQAAAGQPGAAGLIPLGGPDAKAQVWGRSYLLLRVAVADMPGLEALIETLNPYGETRTSLVLSTPIALRAVPPPD